jgi:hypothetical protein
MAEEFQNTISLYGPVEDVEANAHAIGATLVENLRSASTGEFILLWNGGADPLGTEEILDECLVDSVVFQLQWAKISLAFQTRRAPFPAKTLVGMMEKYPEVYLEIHAIGDCSGFTGILAQGGKNLALRRLGLGKDSTGLPSLFAEYFSHLVCRSKHLEGEKSGGI